MAYDTYLADRIRTIIGDTADITEKKMFGGLAFLYKGKMTVGIIKDDLMVRIVGTKHQSYLDKPHVNPMAFTGKPMKEFVQVESEGFDSEEDLINWIALGIEHAKNKLGEID